MLRQPSGWDASATKWLRSFGNQVVKMLWWSSGQDTNAAPYLVNFCKFGSICFVATKDSLYIWIYIKNTWGFITYNIKYSACKGLSLQIRHEISPSDPYWLSRRSCDFEHLQCWGLLLLCGHYPTLCSSLECFKRLECSATNRCSSLQCFCSSTLFIMVPQSFVWWLTLWCWVQN